MNLRMIGLGAVVVFTALLPLAAVAGPAGEPESAAPAGDAADSRPRTEPSDDAGLLSGIDASDDQDDPRGDPADDAVPDARTTRCGPELTSPDGVEAQTCVLAEGRDTWARTYYRNASGEPLDSVLTLMGPAGRTVQAHCEVAVEDEPGTCETPRERTLGELSRYVAVAEFARTTAGGEDADEAPLLLRSGSNPADPAVS
ncbi:hypothetical protein ABT160_08250 [Streptomyces sp. NPDC001941]|uniref:hypothetical protein n=1 Tax=Streptomyces sp. NPDC001941 TaxID=3154659 RepID=UPI0033263C96